MANEVVVKSNHLVEASYRLTLNEQRLVLAAISKIDYQQKGQDTITLTAKEFVGFFSEIGKKNGHLELIKAAKKLWERSIKVSDPNQTKEFRWIQTKIDHHTGEGRITIEFSREIKKYIHQLQGFFTKYKLKEISNLNSTYSIRMYELIKQFEKLGTRKIELEKFRDFFQLGEKYKEFKILKRALLTPAIGELNKKSPLTISVDLLKEQRRVVALSFNWQEKASEK